MWFEEVADCSTFYEIPGRSKGQNSQSHQRPHHGDEMCAPQMSSISPVCLEELMVCPRSLQQEPMGGKGLSHRDL